MDKNYARPRVPLRTSQLHIDEKAADPTYWVTGSRQHPGVSLLSSLSRPCLRSESQSEDGISHRVHHTRASAAGQPGQTVRAPRTACASTRVGTARSVTVAAAGHAGHALIPAIWHVTGRRRWQKRAAMHSGAVSRHYRHGVSVLWPVIGCDV